MGSQGDGSLLLLLLLLLRAPSTKPLGDSPGTLFRIHLDSNTIARALAVRIRRSHSERRCVVNQCVGLQAYVRDARRRHISPAHIAGRGDWRCTTCRRRHCDGVRRRRARVAVCRRDHLKGGIHALERRLDRLRLRRRDAAASTAGGPTRSACTSSSTR